MQIYKNLTILGTSHIAIESINAVRETIENKKPDIVALELDNRRFFALMQKNRKKVRLKDIKFLGLKGWLLNLLGAWAEEKLGKMVGVAPGSDMKGAVYAAKNLGANIALVDQDITITLKNLSKRITFREYYNFLVDLLKGLIFRNVKIEFDLRKVPTERVIQKMIKEVKRGYPSVYQTLIVERNEVIAQNLYRLQNKFNDKRIVAIVGAGHEKSIIEKIKRLDKDGF